MDEGQKGFKINWYLVALIAVLLVAAGARLYFFDIYKNQPVWWDESEHLLMAKHIAFDTPKTGWNSGREILVPLIFSIFFKIFNSELFVRFIQVLFSLGIVFLTYLVGKEIFDRKIGLIASFMMGVFYLNLFFSLRFGLEMIAPFFALLTVYYFWKGYVKKEKPLYIFLAAAFGALAFMASSKEGLLFLSILFFLIFTDKFKFLKNKYVWISLLIGLLLLAPSLLYYKNVTGEFLPRGSAVAAAVGGDLSEGQWSWRNFSFFINYFPTFLQLPFFLLFLVGLILVLLTIALGFDLMIKGEEKTTSKYLFLILWAAPPLFAFSYFLGIAPGNYGEPRFMLEIFPAIFLITAQGLMKIYDGIKKSKKGVAIFVILLILVIGAFYQLRLADSTIKGSSTSFLQIRDAALWMRGNSQEGDWIVSASTPQTTYYSERSVQGIAGDLKEEEFKEIVQALRPKFMVVSVFEPHPQWYMEWPNNNPSIVRPVQAYTTGQSGQEVPLLVIYEFINYDF